MKKANILVFIFLIVAILTGILVFSLYRTQQSAVTTPNNVEQTTQSGTEQIVNVQTLGIGLIPQNDSEAYGGVELVSQGSNTKVTITLTSDNPTVMQTSHPAHIHTGSCPTPGEVKYPLNNVVNGKSETVIEASLNELANDIPLAINVHESAANPSNYIACGDFPMPQ